VSVRVVIADDQALVRGGFRMILDANEDMEVVGEAGDGGEAVGLAEGLLPDVVLMDVRMPSMDGIEATRRIVASGCRARIIMLTTYDLHEYVFAALRAGASGFMLKDVRPPDLVDAIRSWPAATLCSRRRSLGACSTRGDQRGVAASDDHVLAAGRAGPFALHGRQDARLRRGGDRALAGESRSRFSAWQSSACATSRLRTPASWRVSPRGTRW
jgi:CheY-like chemotaxis protein